MNGEDVVVVSGMPRSGTSMMMQMLVAGGLTALTDQVREADEDNSEGYFEFEPVKKLREDCSWIAEARGKALKVIYMLLYELPQHQNYRVVFLKRDLDEVLASQQKMLERSGRTGATLPPDKLKSIFEEQIDKAEQWLAEQPNFDVLFVEHRRVLQEAESEVRRINEFLGDGLNESAMCQVVNPTLYRQRAGA